MGFLRGVLDSAVEVGKGLLGIAADAIGSAKRALADLVATMVVDPLARRNNEQQRRHYEGRQAEIDAEILDIHKQVKRDGRMSPEARERYDELIRESDGIARKLGARETVASTPDEYDVVFIDPDHIHIVEWHIGQATEKRCPKCGQSMILQLPRAQILNAHPSYFWGCTGFYFDLSDRRHCRNTENVTKADFGTLLPRDNEALAMSRVEMCRKAFDNRYGRRIGQDLVALRGHSFPAYRCPVHSVGMVLKRKREPMGKLDVWYLKCPSPLPHNNGYGCPQMAKLKTVAQVLAVRQFGTGEIF